MSSSTVPYRPFWTKRGYILPLVAGLVLNGAVYVALTYRLATKQERLARQHAALSKEAEQKRAKLAELASERARIARNEEVAERFWNEVAQPLEPGLTEAWAELKRLTRESGLESGRIAFSYKPHDVGLTQVTASMPLEGSYFNLVRFINTLERSPRFFLIQEIGLSRARGEGIGVALRCDVSFFLKGSPSGRVEQR